MAHPEQQYFFNSVKSKFPNRFVNCFVLDIGSLDINGNNQHLFESASYLGLDIAPGKNVDLISKGHELGLPNETFDVIMSGECFEHDPFYQKTVLNMLRMLKPGGLMLFSCATTGRPEHGTRRTTPSDAPFLQDLGEWSDYYKNLDESDFRAFINFDEEFSEYAFSTNPLTYDIYFYGIKKGSFTPRTDYSFLVAERSIKDKVNHIFELFESYKEDNRVLFEKNGKLLEGNGKLTALYTFELQKSDALRQEIKILNDSKSNLEKEKQLYASELWNTRNTVSWKITSPIRLFRRALAKAIRVLKAIVRKVFFLNKLAYMVRSFGKKMLARGMALAVGEQHQAIDALTTYRKEFIEKVNYLNFSDLSNYPVVDISVVTYQSERWIDQFLGNIICLDYPLDRVNLIFVDNSSTDQTFEKLTAKVPELSKLFSSVRIIQAPNNGFGAGHDLAIQSSRAEFVLVTNIDLKFETDALTQLMSFVLADTEERYASWELRQIPYEHPKYYDPVTFETNWSSHACILMRRSAYEKVGGYEPRIFMYAEDVELSYRFRSYGYRLQYCPHAVVHHFSYQHAGEVKPIQFSGSTLGNAYVRLRYGNWRDKFAIAPLYIALLLWPEAYPGAKKAVLSNIKKIAVNARSFLTGKGHSLAFYPFNLFDYEMIREGAFHECLRCIDGPKVSVVIRTYRGREHFLLQAVQSVFNQTYRNLELVIVEDGGNTMQSQLDILSPRVSLDMKYYACEKVGRSVTGNKGLSEATGEYAMFLDDDDLLFPDHIETIMAELIADKSLDAAYALAMQVFTQSDNSELKYHETKFETPASFKQEFDYEVLLDHNFIPIQAIIFKRELFLERGGFETDMDQLEDWNLWLRYAYGKNFKYIPKTTSLFRVPADDSIRLQRHLKLHEAYHLAKSRAQEKTARM